MKTLEKNSTESTDKIEGHITQEDDRSFTVHGGLAADLDDLAARGNETIGEVCERAVHLHLDQCRKPADETTSVELDAETIAKLRAILRALKTPMTAEVIINDWLESTLRPGSSSGYIQESVHDIEGWAARTDKREINQKIDRIIAGDKRLVRAEPEPKNLTAYGSTLTRLRALASTQKSTTNWMANVILRDALDKIERGEAKITECGATSAAG